MLIVDYTAIVLLFCMLQVRRQIIVIFMLLYQRVLGLAHPQVCLHLSKHNIYPLRNPPIVVNIIQSII